MGDGDVRKSFNRNRIFPRRLPSRGVDGGDHRQRPRAVPASMPRRRHSRDHMRRLPTTTETRRGQEDEGWPKIGLIRRRRGVSLFLFLFPYVQLD